jgi:hypothetical protein
VNFFTETDFNFDIELKNKCATPMGISIPWKFAVEFSTYGFQTDSID